MKNIKIQNAKGHHHGLYQKIVIPLLAVILFQSVVFFCATFYGGISGALKQNAEDVLSERVANQQSALESKFTTQWANFAAPEAAITKIYSEVKAASDQPVSASAEAQRAVLEQSVEPLIAALRNNEVTGVFLILNDSESFAPLQPGETQSRYGICIRDYDPTSSFSATEDLLVKRCPTTLAKNIGCALDTGWDALCTFDDSHTGEYFYRPLQLAYENPGADAQDLAYFCGPHNMNQNDQQVVSYSIPLVDETGYPFCVLGVELTVSYLQTLLPASTLYGDNGGGYALVQYAAGSQSYRMIATSGVLFQQCFGGRMSFDAAQNTEGILTVDDTLNKVRLSGGIRDLQIYNHNTPFEDERLALVGFVKEDSLYSVNSMVNGRLTVVSLGMLVLGAVLVLLVSRRVTRPILSLSQKVRSAEGTQGVQLERLQIDEIDDLIEAIEELNDKINRAAIRNEFFSRMSHDMRTPMNAIIGFSSPEMLENADLEQMRSYMDKIHSSGGYLLGLINEVLDMAKIETQRMELREEPLNQKMLFEEVAPMIQELATEKSVDFRMKFDPNGRAFYGDRQRLAQIFMNLLSNAVKFTPAGGRVLLQMQELAHDDNTVTNLIVVQDSGIGMSEEFQKKMYEPFSQAVGGQGGTGLGLAIARQMVGLMNGTINCESAPGKGTCFTIRLTSRLAEKAAEEKIAQKPEQDTTWQSAALQGKHILLCEDHPLNMQIARRLLERCGITVQEAHDGAEGLALFEKSAPGEFDAILMDIRMPNMNGIDAAKAIRILPREDAGTVPIIAMTANAFQEDVEQSRSAGMNAHISKPVDPKILYSTLLSCMSG